MRYNKEFRFFAEDFWNIFNQQKGLCYLTGRKLTETNTEVELVNPHLTKEEGRADLSNHYMVDHDLKHLARYLSAEEIVHLSAEIISWRGKEYGYSITKKKEKGQ